jgi:hypothetical protein
VPVEQNPSFPLPRPTTLAGRRFEPDGHAAERARRTRALRRTRLDAAALARLHGAARPQLHSKTHNGAFLFQLGRSKNLRQFGGGSRLADSLQGRRRDTDALAYTDNLVLSPDSSSTNCARKSRACALRRAPRGTRPVVLITFNDPLSSDRDSPARSSPAPRLRARPTAPRRAFNFKRL